MSGLDQTATEALQALGVARAPDHGAAERAWLQMQRRIVDGPPPMELGPDEIAPARTRWLAVGLGVVALAAAAALLLTWGPKMVVGVDDSAKHSAPYSNDERAPSEPMTVETARAGATADESPAATAEVPTNERAPAPEAAAPATNQPAPSDAGPRVRPSKTPRASASSDTKPATEAPAAPKTTTLAAELRLLGQANAATRKGDAAAALASLERHRREFPDGQLAPERELARAVALCDLGRRDAARAVVAAFARDHGDSPLAAKVQGTCRE